MYVMLVVQALVFLFFFFFFFFFYFGWGGGGAGEGGAEPSLAEKKNGLHWGAEQACFIAV